MNNYNILNIAIGAFGFLIMQVSEFWTNLDPATKFISWILGAILLIISIITNLISLRMKRIEYRKMKKEYDEMVQDVERIQEMNK